MLRLTFQLFRGVSAERERKLWDGGITDWEQYRELEAPQKSLFSDEGRNVPASFAEVFAAYEQKDTAFFADRLDRSEHYRIALTFPAECLFLDIETTGLSRYYNHITAIGWSSGANYDFFVKGQSDKAFREAIAKAKCIVTFNGSLFDLPFIAQEFPDIRFPPVHVDLRFLAKRVGLTGGQKEIESKIRFARNRVAKSVTGELAPVLWHKYMQGDLESLRTLLTYNAADIRGMKAIFDTVAPKLQKKLHLPKNLRCKRIFLEEEADSLASAISARISSRLTPYPASEAAPLRIEDVVLVDQLPKLKVVGIDLTGSEARPSGWCFLDGREAVTAMLGSDDEIVARTTKEKPHLISIDSPLTLPEGRVTVDDSDPGRKEFGIMRYSERVLKKRGVNVYPALLPSMQRLTARGIALSSRLRALGFPVIESYPGAAQDIMRIPRKRQGLEYLEQGLASFGVSGLFVKGGASHDELDAITSAIVGVFFWAGMYERLGKDPLGDEALIIPDLRADHLAQRNRLIIGLSGALGAGKTTAAEYLRAQGFTYCRYSEVIAARVSASKPKYTRQDLQVEGELVHKNLGQRWLTRQLLQHVKLPQFLVIDGLRFPDDHAFLTEIFGAQFLHIHVVAPYHLRKARFGQREGASVDFDKQDGHPVERHVPKLAEFARDVVDNQDDVDIFLQRIDNIAQRDWKR